MLNVSYYNFTLKYRFFSGPFPPPPPDTLPAPFKAPGFLSYRASPALPAKGYKFP
jgi:hypothetical protein